MKTSHSHSHHRRHHSSATFSKKFMEVHGFGSQASYDDLNLGLSKFGAPTVSCRVEDYYEIFNSSRASRATSIPILDLPQTNERLEHGRVKSSEVDYSNIFGGFNDVSFATTYDDMFGVPKREESSSEDAWTPAETGSPSDDSDSLNSYEASHQAFDAKKQVNMSYHKTNLRSRDGTNGTTHIAQLHAVPGFTFVIDEESKLQSIKQNETSQSEVSDAAVSVNVSGEIYNVKHHRRAVSDFPNHNAHQPTSEIDFSSGSFSVNTLLGSYGTGLGTKHFSNGSTVPYIPQNFVDVDNVFHRSKPQNCVGSKSSCFSSSSSDEEVDANSVAAASAIALRKAITEAQARIRIAKNSLERKNRGFNRPFMSSFKDSLKAKNKRKDEIDATKQVLIENCGSTCFVKQNVDRVVPTKSPNLGGDIEIPHSWEGPKGKCGDDYISILEGKELNMASIHGRMKQCNDELDMDEQSTNEEEEKVVHGVDAFELKDSKIAENICEASVSAPYLEIIEQNLCADQSLEENKTELNVFQEQEESEKSLKASLAGIKTGDKSDNCPMPVQANEHEIEQWQENEYESSLEDAYESFEIDKQLEVVDEQEKSQHGLEEASICEDHESNLEYEEIDESRKGDCECTKEFEEGQKKNGWEEKNGPDYSYKDEDNYRELQEGLRQNIDDSNLCNAEFDEPQISEEDQELPGMMGKSRERLRKRKLWIDSCPREEKGDTVHSDNGLSEPEESVGAKNEAETVDCSHTQEPFTHTGLEPTRETLSHDKNIGAVEETSDCCEMNHSEEIDMGLVGNVSEGDIKYDEIMKKAAFEDDLIFERKETIFNSEGRPVDLNTNASAIGGNSVENKVTISEDEEILRTRIPCNEDKEVERCESVKIDTEMDAKEEKKEVEIDIDVDEEAIRRMNEEKVKERERQEGRIAVERAIREARERAFAETQERVVKAKAKEKGSEEALLLKTQRSLVERATSEARHRALQKALSEKSSFEGGRDNAHRSSTKKVYDTKHRSSDPSSSSANHGSSNTTERFDGASKGESAQRCQAKLERHHRTIERAAKALAEKNMRDLRVQKEQAERNRLAESLDAEVKRWSSGKHGNLRALLSTLQYILGPESGWHAVPLTEIITAISVKKAYRKAALCVHPDKLQQRGATIHQKYICEKVFDLLKDAWNKFNSEER